MELHHTLQNLCFESGWCYAGFWKLDHMDLRWEDGFFQHPLSNTYEDEGNPFHKGNCVSEATSYSKGRIRRAITKMSYSVYPMGEGIIGRVAFTGKAQWVFGDGGGNSKLGIASRNTANIQMLEKYPASFDMQFSAGIKTIAVIAVPQGVVQLGSTQMIAENAECVNHVKSAFGALRNIRMSSFSDLVQGRKASEAMDRGLHLLTYELHGQSSNVEEKSNISNPLAVWQEIKALRYDMHIADPSICTSQLDEISHSTPNSSGQAASVIPHERSLGSEIYVNGPACLQAHMFTEDRNKSSVDSLLSCNSILDSRSCFSAASVLGSASPKSEVALCNLAPPLSDNYCVPATASNSKLLDEASFSSLMVKGATDGEDLVGSKFDDASQSIYSSSKDTTPYSSNKNLYSVGCSDFANYAIVHGRRKWDCSFPIGDELSQALVPVFKQVPNEKETWDENLNKMSTTQQSGRMYGFPEESLVQVVPSWISSIVKEYGHLQGTKSEPLLDAVVTNASRSHHSVSSFADQSFSARAFSGMDDEISVLDTTKETGFKSARCNSSSDELLSRGFVKAFHRDCDFSGEQHTSNMISFNASDDGLPLKPVLSFCTEGMPSDSTHISQSKKSEVLSKVTRKRARPSESTRARPKDRQQIQDRVRELRELVPEGSKCSIDALLEKTIKHLLFLQSVNLHVDNLKHNREELKDDGQSGTSWGFELGGEQTGHPILVKNLNQSRILLVEMFCEEKSHLLEIADVIRNLGLSILKGVMEYRCDKIWAQFIVESSRDVHRLEIIMSLMHLVHVNDNATSSMTN